MEAAEKLNRIKFLEEQILKHKALYYQGKPEIDDFAYDKIEEELKALNPDSFALSIVGTKVASTSKIKHDKPMLSLDKVYDFPELKKWIGNNIVVSTFKLDGISGSMVYHDGELVLAKTRGDGQYGEDITDKVRWIPTVPKRINVKKDIEIRGELYCNEENFFTLSEEMIKNGEERPTSQRNIVAGLIGRKEHLEFNRYISFMAYDIVDPDSTAKTEIDFHNELEQLGFVAAPMQIHSTTQSVENAIKEAQEFMSEGDYQIDGIVFSYNDLSLREVMGFTAHHPKYKMAFKFRGESKTTRLNAITWQVSRNGILTPVGEVEPVEISGAKISRVTLHNYGMVKLHELKEGDEIEIIRSGEVIPKFVSVVKSSGNEFNIPSICPSCGEPLTIKEIRLVCTNDNCPDKVKETILNFIQKIGIDDLSSKRLEEMMSQGLVKGIPDLYRLNVPILLTLKKTKETLAQKLYESINKSRHVDLTTFLSALGISGGAYNKCEKVVSAGFDTIEKIKSLTIEQLMTVDSFAEVSSKEFVTSLQTKMDLIDELLGLGFEFKVKENSSSELNGKKICITGALSEKRSVIEGKIRAVGGIVVSSVSKNTDYLLTNETDPSSSKFKKAVDLNIPVLTEVQFLAMLE